MTEKGAKATEAVRTYWEARPCGSSLAEAEQGSPQFFDEIEKTRYRLEPFIPAPQARKNRPNGSVD